MADVRPFAAYVLAQTGWRAYYALGLLLLSTLMEGVSLLLLVPVLQFATVRQGAAMVSIPTGPLQSWFGGPLELSLALALGLLVLLISAQALLTRYKNIYLARLLYDFVDGVRMALFTAIGRAKWQFVARKRSSDLQTLLTTDMDRIQSGAFYLFLLAQNAVVLVAYVGVSWLISPPMTLLATGLGAVVLAALTPVRRQAAAYGRTLSEQRQQQLRTVTDFLSGMKVAKSLNAEPRYFAEMRSILEALRNGYIAYTRVSSFSGLLFQIGGAIAVSGFVYVAIEVYALPLAQIVVLIFVFTRISPRFSSVQSHVQEILANAPAFAHVRATTLQCEAETEKVSSVAAEPPKLQRGITFDGVSFAYSTSPSDMILPGLSFSIPALQVTALIGPSGSGKSTVADLLLGLLEPTSGRILLDDTPLDERTRRFWRERVAYVPQEVFLLHDTIAGNLRVAAPSATEEEMWAALEAANARSFVERLPEGLQTTVGDRGVRFSGGERQRIALARGLLRKPELLLLDEATSALDWESQLLIARSIEALRGQLTVLTIAHRPSMISFADWVVALEKGRVVEAGPYEELRRRRDSPLSRLLAGETTSVPA